MVGVYALPNVSRTEKYAQNIILFSICRSRHSRGWKEIELATNHIHCQERDANIFRPIIFKVAGSVSHSRLMRLQTLTSRIPVVTTHCYFTPPDLYLVFTPSLGLAGWVAPKTPSAVLRTQGPTPSPRSAGRGLCDGCYFPAI